MKAQLFLTAQLLAIAMGNLAGDANAIETILAELEMEVPATANVCFTTEDYAKGKAFIQDIISASAMSNAAFAKAQNETDHMALSADYREALVGVDQLIKVMQTRLEPIVAKIPLETPPCVIDDHQCDHQLIQSTGALVQKDLMGLLQDSMATAAITDPAQCAKIYKDEFKKSSDLICDMRKLTAVVQACIDE